MTHTFLATLTAGRYYEIVLDQPESDLSIEVIGPGDKLFAKLDAFTFGKERLFLCPLRSGGHRIRVSNGAVQSRYELSLSYPLESLPVNATWTEALRLTDRAKASAAVLTAENLESALKDAQMAADLWHSLNDSDSEVRALLLTGDILRKLTRVAEARVSFRRAHQTAAPADDARTLAEAINNAGVCSWQLGETTDAHAEFSEAIKQWDRAKYAYGRAASLENLGLLSWQTGQIEESLRLHRLALPVFRQYLANEATALTLNNLALAYSAGGQHQLALAQLRLAIPLFPKNDPTAIARALTNIASIQLLLGRKGSAAEFARRSLFLLRKSTDKRAIGEARITLGRAMLAQGKIAEAISLLDDARHQFEAAGDRRGQASVAHHLGLAYTLSDRPADGVQELTRALQLRREIGIFDMAAESLFEIARIEDRRGNLQEARARLEEALNLAESLRTQVPGEQFRALFFAAKQPYYQLEIDVLARLGLSTEAFYACERSRARSLLDLLSDTRGDILRGIPPALLREERDLQARLNFNAQQLLRSSATRDPAHTAAIRDTIEALTAQYDQLEGKIRDNSAQYAVMQSGPSQLSEIQQLLDDDTTLIEFSLGRERSYAWVITRRSGQMLPLPARAIIERPARIAVRALSVHPDRRGASDTEVVWRAALNELSHSLLREVSPLVHTSRIALVGDGILQYVPFAALPDPQDPGRRFAEQRELIILPSASTLASLRHDRPGRVAATKTVAIFADPVFGWPDSRLRKVPAARPVRDLPASGITAANLSRLSFSGREVLAISKLVRPEERWVATGFAANKFALLSARTGQYRILHLSTHALIDDETPLLSGLALSQFDAKGNPRDGILRLHEIYNLDLSSTDLVVLSACKTGLGREVNGEGLLGFTRAFFYAGVRTLAITLWEVDDEATAALTDYFYRYTLGPTRMTPAAALARAQTQLQTHRRWRDPYYWAGVAMTGDWQSRK